MTPVGRLCCEKGVLKSRPCTIHRVEMEALRIEKAMKDPSIVIMNSREEHCGPQVVRSRFGTDWLMKDFDIVK